MELYLRKDFQKAYFLPKRTGSSLFYDLYHNLPSINSNYFYFSSDISALKLLNEDTKIYFTYRDPWKRFISGLHVSMYNLAGDVSELLAREEGIERGGLVKNEGAIQLLNVFSEYLKGKNSNNVNLNHFYHLEDTHTDHILGVLAILAYGGYNLIPINTDSEWTKHLCESFPENENDILGRSATRAKPYGYNNFNSIILWECFKEIFIDRQNSSNCAPHISYYDWMDKEYELYRIICTSKNLNLCKDELLNIMLENNYFMYDKSPLLDVAIELINVLLLLNKPVHPELVKKFNHFKFIKKLKKQKR